MSSRTRLLSLFLLLVMGLVAAFLALGPRQVTRGSRTPDATDPTDEGVSAEGALEANRRGELESGAAGRTLPSAEGAATAEEGPLLRVAGRIVTAGAGEPVARATLALDAADDYATVETDANGRFQLELASSSWRMGETYRATVTRAGNQRLFLGNVVLEPELLIRTRLRLLLRGQLVANFDLSRARASVQAHVPPAGSVHVAVYAGRDELDAEGRFEIEAWAEQEPAAFRLTFEALSSRLLIADVPTRELVSAKGARLTCTVGELALHVVDRDAEPLADARIRVFGGGSGGDAAWFEAATNPEGRAELLVAPGRVEVCVGREGYSFEHRFLVLGAQLVPRTEEVVLRRLELEEFVSGRVLDADGEPVEEAYVSGFPRTEHPEVASAGHVGVPSDEEGAFLLPIAGETPIEVSAYHEEFGSTAPVVLAPGERDVTLRFEPTGGLEVDLTGIPREDGAVADTVQWILVGERTFSSHGWGLPFEIEHIPVGTYELFVYLGGSGLLGRRKVTVQNEEFAEESLPVERIVFATGRLTRDGSPLSGCTLELVESGWPEEVRRLWGRDTTDLEGRFRLPLGGEAVVLDAGGDELGRLQVAPGEGSYALP